MLLQYYYMLCWMYSPSGARTGVLSVGVRFSSFSWHIFPESGPFVVHHRPIWDPAVNLCLLDPLLANHLGSQDHQHEYISLHALNPLCPGLEPATAPLALAEDCVMRVNWACHPPVIARQGSRFPTGPALDTAPASLDLVRPPIRNPGHVSAADKPRAS